MNKFMLGLSAALSLSLCGCANFNQARNGDWHGPLEAQQPANFLIVENYNASDALIAKAKAALDPDKPIIMATIVNIDDLERSSTLGRFVTENISARFTQANFKMIELKFQNAVYMKRNEGELMLTRQIRDLAQTHNAQAVIVGTYSKASSSVFINLKIVRPESNIVIAAHDYALGIDRNVSNMLQEPINSAYRDQSVKRVW